MREIKIDFDNPGLPQRLDVVENDAQSRFFKAVLYKDGKAYTAPSGATYSIMYRGFGPQNEGWYDTINDGDGKRAACSVSGNVVTCEIARQALRVPGHVSVVLCVTGSNGYMLHGWPIDCNCRNDNYTGGTSVESFFYITQVTNADWTSAIQTWEELKNMIDPTLSLSGKAADAEKVGEAVGQIKEDLGDLRIKSKNMFFVEQGEIVNGIITVNAEKSGSVLRFKQNGQITSNVYAVIKRLELEVGKTYTFSATRKSGYYNDSGAISLGIYRTDNNAIVDSFSFWEILNGSSNSFTFTPDYSSYYIQVVFASTGTIKEYDCDINFNLVEGAIADYSEYGYVNISKELPTIKYLLKHNIYDIVVAKDGSGDYTTVTEAVANCDDFSTIYVKNGVYENEIIKAWLKTVFIIGESREGVIIKNNTGAYDTPPIEMGTGMLKNLTVYAEGNATPNNKGYALHSESSVEASSCNFFILENCTFKSDYRQSWGMGMRGDTHYYARNCTFEEVYFHDCEHEYRATNQYIEFDSCNIIAKANETALLLQDQQMISANVNLMFNRCLVKSENGANIQYGKWTGSGIEWVSSLDDFPTWHLSTYSFGNSDNALNA